MRDPARIDRLLNKLRVAWQASPDQRLTQLLSNLVRGEWPARHGVSFNTEDDVVEAELDIHLANGCNWSGADQ